jgi:hypothetical protein
MAWVPWTFSFVLRLHKSQVLTGSYRSDSLTSRAILEVLQASMVITAREIWLSLVVVERKQANAFSTVV